MFLYAALLTATLVSPSQDSLPGQVALTDPAPVLQPGLPWTMLPRAETSFGADIHGGWLYVLGGYHGIPHEYRAAGQSPDFYRVSLADPRLVEQLPSSGAVQSVSLDGHGGDLWRVGGMSIKDLDEYDSEMVSLATVARFDPEQRAWEAMPSLPEARSSHETAVVGGTLYVVGGWRLPEEGAWAKDMLALDLANPGEGWRSIPQPFERRALAVAGTSQHVLAIGGISSDHSTPQRVDVYDVKSETWSQGPDFPGAAFAASAHAIGDLVYATGRDGGVYRWTVGEGEWTKEAADLTFPRFFGQLVGTNQALYLLGGIGGMNRSGRIRAVEHLPFGRAEAPASSFGLPLPAGMLASADVQLDKGSLHVRDGSGSLWSLRLTDLAWKRVAADPANAAMEGAAKEAAATSGGLRLRGRRIGWALMPGGDAVQLAFHLEPSIASD